MSDSNAAASTPKTPREKTRRIMVGSVPMGGGAPVVVQSMLNEPAADAQANLHQIERLVAAGCEVIRMAVPNKESLDSFETVCAHSPLPVVADIHFSAELAIGSIKRGAAKLRINPGNIGGLAACDPVIEAAREAKIPIRIGVNAGSLDKELAAREDLTLAEKLAQSACDYAAYFSQRGFEDLVISAKAHDVPTTIAAYRLLASRLPETPLHLGVTEAGTSFQGLIKSACGLGVLLEEGIGDTLRISLTDDPAMEVRACWTLLGSLGLRQRGFELISCPTCGRTLVGLIPLAQEVEQRLMNDASLVRNTSIVQKEGRALKVAVMGCVVNGPGEAADADIGVACGNGCGALFVRGEVIRKVPEDAIVDALLEEIGKL